MCDVFEFQTTVRTTTVIYGQHDITQLSHVEIPTTNTIIISVCNVLCVRTAVYINNSRILLACIEVYWFHQTIVQVCLAISRLDSAQSDFWHVVGIHWMFCIQEIDFLTLTCCWNYADITCNVVCSIAVDNIFTALRQLYAMCTFSSTNQTTLAVLYVYGISIALQR